jgi:hypothetical protein
MKIQQLGIPTAFFVLCSYNGTRMTQIKRIDTDYGLRLVINSILRMPVF